MLHCKLDWFACYQHKREVQFMYFGDFLFRYQFVLRTNITQRWEYSQCFEKQQLSVAYDVMSGRVLISCYHVIQVSRTPYISRASRQTEPKHRYMAKVRHKKWKRLNVNRNAFRLMFIFVKWSKKKVYTQIWLVCKAR